MDDNLNFQIVKSVDREMGDKIFINFVELK